MINKHCILRSTEVGEDEQKIKIKLPDTCTIVNGDVLRFVIIQTIPTDSPTARVIVELNGIEFNLLTKFGNSVRVDQLRTRIVYKIGVGTQIPNMVMQCRICPTEYEYPVIPTPA